MAIVLVGERHFLIIDSASGFVSRRRGICLAFTRAAFAIADLKQIDLVTHVRHSGRRRRERYRLLVNKSGQSVLAESGEVWHARKVGERVCAALNVPFDNRIYGAHSVRDAGELDLNVAERWRLARRAKDRPSQPPGSRLVLDEAGADARLWLPAETHNLKVLALLVAVFAVIGAVSWFNVETTGQRVFFYLFFGGAGIFLTYGALAFSGKSLVTFTGKRVSFRQGRAPSSTSLKLEEIEEMIAADDGLYLVGDTGVVRIHWVGERAESEFIEAWVAYHLARRTPLAANQALPSGSA